MQRKCLLQPPLPSRPVPSAPHQKHAHAGGLQPSTPRPCSILSKNNQTPWAALQTLSSALLVSRASWIKFTAGFPPPPSSTMQGRAAALLAAPERSAAGLTTKLRLKS